MTSDPVSTDTIKKLLPDAGSNPKIIQLAGDASTRRYYRVNYGSVSSVVMSAKDPVEVTNFISMTNLMKNLGADVPTILGADGACLALEDLGDTLLQNRITGMSQSQILSEYRAVVDDLVRFQSAVSSFTNRSNPCWGLSFDVEKLSWEVEFANTHFIHGYLQIAPRPGLMEALAEEWKWIIGDLASEMETLAHRDFHSRNIMAIDGRRVWIDYQDARMGRRLYDLASLLLDPYVALSPGVIEKLAEHYYDRLVENGDAPWDKARFHELFDLSGLQRIYKALGTYGNQTTVRGVDVYVPYIEPSMRTLLRICQSRKELGRLSGILHELFKSSI
ncbi:MAG: phosphotransferase [Nitrospinae bacterium]|nr:phosphotransferase [Nitrospinota bacterium]MBF0633451.1 phosphotransferase [Nitrospinota bacterium]